MFEQQSYAFDVPAEPLREGDLFYQHEVGRWKFDNRLYAIIVGSAVFIFAFFGGIAQTPILTARGCDSPFVGRVCQVLDMAYVGTMLYGTDREYVDAAYDKIDLSEAEVVWIDQTGVPAQMEYPEGYFQIANPEQFAMQQSMLNGTGSPYDLNSSGFPPVTPPVTSGSSLIDTPAIAPKNNPKARPDNLPDSPFELPDEDSTADSNKGTTNVDSNKKPNANQTANSNAQKSEPPLTSSPVEAVEINRQVMKDFGKSVVAKIDSSEVNLSSNFKVYAYIALTPDGKMDVSVDKRTKKPKSGFISAEGDPQMVEVAKEAIEAIGNSGWLKYLKNEGVNTLSFTLSQDDNQLSVEVLSEYPSPETAKRISSGLNGLFSGALLADRMNLKKLGDDEKLLLSKASAISDGKQVKLIFAMPKPEAREMMDRNLQKVRESETGQKPNSRNDLIKSASSTTAE